VIGSASVEIAGPADAYPSAAVLVSCALPVALAAGGVAADDLSPLYLRTADVRINWEQRSVPAQAR
jgi:hypothetical protein